MEKIVLTLSQNSLNVIGQGLQDLPYRVSAPVIAEIQQQLMEQQKTREEKKDQSSL